MKTIDEQGNVVDEVTLVKITEMVPGERQGRRFDKLDIISGQSVAAGADFMTAPTYDFSQYELVQYGYKTTSAGSGTTNLILFTLEGSTYKGSIKSGLGSNDATFRNISTPYDLRGYDTIGIGFRNADISPITVDLKAYCQY